MLTAATAVQAVISMGTLTLPAVAPLAAASLGVDSSLIGFQVSLVYGVATVAALLGGRLVRRFGACRTSQLGLLFLAAGCALAAVPSLPVMAVASMILGVAYGLPNPAASHLLIRFTDAGRRNLVFSLKQSGVPLGGVMAGLIGPGLALLAGWQAPLLLASAVALLLAALLQRRRALWDGDREPGLPIRGLPLEGFPLVMRRPALRWLVLTTFLLAGVQLCLTTFLVVLLVQDLGYSAVIAGGILALVQASSVGGRVAWGWVADRVGDGLAVLLGVVALQVATAAAVVFFTPATPLWLVLAVFLLLGATGIGWNGVFMAEIARLSPVGRIGEVTACALFFTYMGVLVGPAGFTFGQAAMGGYLPGYLLLAAAGAAALLLILLARRAARRA